MNFLKRAIKYCVRQRLRTLLLFLTFTLLSTTVLIAVSSEEAVLQGTKQIKETVGASLRMEIDMNNQNNFGPAEDSGKFRADSGHGECTRFVSPLYCSIGFFFRYKIFKWNI